MGCTRLWFVRCLNTEQPNAEDYAQRLADLFEHLRLKKQLLLVIHWVHYKQVLLRDVIQIMLKHSLLPMLHRVISVIPLNNKPSL
jgi:hypothetical protein